MTNFSTQRLFKYLFYNIFIVSLQLENIHNNHLKQYWHVFNTRSKKRDLCKVWKI